MDNCTCETYGYCVACASRRRRFPLRCQCRRAPAVRPSARANDRSTRTQAVAP